MRIVCCLSFCHFFIFDASCMHNNAHALTLTLTRTHINTRTYMCIHTNTHMHTHTNTYKRILTHRHIHAHTGWGGRLRGDSAQAHHSASGGSVWRRSAGWAVGSEGCACRGKAQWDLWLQVVRVPFWRQYRVLFWRYAWYAKICDCRICGCFFKGTPMGFAILGRVGALSKACFS